MADQAWHDRYKKKLDVNIATTTNRLAYEQKLRAIYYLYSILTLWVKASHKYATTTRLDSYAWKHNDNKK